MKIQQCTAIDHFLYSLANPLDSWMEKNDVEITWPSQSSVGNKQEKNTFSVS